MEGSDITGKAMTYATEMHAGQTRKFSGKPYVTHPIKVAKLLSTFTKSPTLIAAAYLHDTIEDTDATYESVKDMFGKAVADLVKELTSLPDGIKELGKAEYLAQKMTAMSADALTIKLCDRLDNVSDGGSAKWREKYARQTRSLMLRLKKLSLNSAHKKIIKRINEIVGEDDVI